MPKHYTKAMLGLPCPVCREKVPQALNDAGERLHATCGPSELLLIVKAHGGSR